MMWLKYCWKGRKITNQNHPSIYITVHEKHSKNEILKNGHRNIPKTYSLFFFQYDLNY